jgi:hypothetical protein
MTVQGYGSFDFDSSLIWQLWQFVDMTFQGYGSFDFDWQFVDMAVR